MCDFLIVGQPIIYLLNGDDFAIVWKFKIYYTDNQGGLIQINPKDIYIYIGKIFLQSDLFNPLCSYVINKGEKNQENQEIYIAIYIDSYPHRCK